MSYGAVLLFDRLRNQPDPGPWRKIKQAMTTYFVRANRYLRRIRLAFGRCWLLAVPPILLAILLGIMGQGRETLTAMNFEIATFFPIVLGFAAVAILTTESATTLLFAEGDQPSKEECLAGRTVAGLLAVLSAMLVPAVLDLSLDASTQSTDQSRHISRVTNLLFAAAIIIVFYRNLTFLRMCLERIARANRTVQLSAALIATIILFTLILTLLYLRFSIHVIFGIVLAYISICAIQFGSAWSRRRVPTKDDGTTAQVVKAVIAISVVLAVAVLLYVLDIELIWAMVVIGVLIAIADAVSLPYGITEREIREQLFGAEALSIAFLIVGLFYFFGFSWTIVVIAGMTTLLFIIVAGAKTVVAYSAMIAMLGTLGFYAPPGATASALFALGFWIAVGFWINQLFRRVGPVLSLIAIIVVVPFFIRGSYSVRDVRILPNTTSTNRTPLNDHVSNWLLKRVQNDGSESHSQKPKYPVVIVTTEGGGIYAAYWSATSLAAIQDETAGKFSEHVLGISGVSGGALGATVFTALVKHAAMNTSLPQLPSDAATRGFSIPGYQAAAAKVLGHDLLTSTLTGVLLTDVVQAPFHKELFENRCTRLERSFEQAWKQELGSDELGDAFQRLWKAGTKDEKDLSLTVPSLFLNGARPDNGRRLIMSNVAASHTFFVEEDIQAILGTQAIAASTAVTMSCRFPIVSPAGQITVSSPDIKVEKYIGVVDGGFYDNSGAATADDVLQVLLSEAIRLNVRDQIDIIILIVSYEVDENKPNLHRVDPGPLGVLSTAGTLNAIRRQSTYRFVAGLSSRAKDNECRVAHMSLRDYSDPYPLGWMLSEQTCKRMDYEIQNFHRNPLGETSGYREVADTIVSWHTQKNSTKEE